MSNKHKKMLNMTIKEVHGKTNNIPLYIYLNDYLFNSQYQGASENVNQL